ncbi:hypothetical protein [Nostoc sp. JL33]|uniref:hypothetical protein n=1 Tax=Nostoc sp. JL33 TaxID=2815396 RepID=UPI0025EB09A1|nr:hypothetical protein [Nostoc sp. JL33]MBN3870879.1 hypothetical protein [Nostoc sp. JL33]
MTKVNKNLENPTLQVKKGAEGLDVKPQKAIPVVDAGYAPYQVDVTPVLLQQPSSPFAIALSISIVIGAIAALIKTLKSG